MPDRVTTSFIPKDSLTTERAPRAVQGNPFVIVNIVAGIILVGTLVAAGALFLFQTYTNAAISSKQDSLEKQRSAFEPATIKELSRLDKRLSASQALLKTHTAVSLMFADLETRSGGNVRFKDFAYDTAGPGVMMVTMSGSAKSFNAIAVQSDAFGKSTIFKDPIFSNVNIDAAGNTIFNFTAKIDTSRITYAALVAGGDGSVPTTLPNSTNATTTTP
jgi:hypothetical protein